MQISPLASPTNQFGRSGAGGSASSAPVAPQLLDFRALSGSLQRLFDERKEFQDTEAAELGATVGSMQARGLSDADILKKVSESEQTPRRVASRLAKFYDAQEGFSRADNPVFKMALQAKRGEASVAEVARKAS